MLLRSYIAAWQSQYRLKSSEFLVPIPDAAERLGACWARGCCQRTVSCVWQTRCLAWVDDVEGVGRISWGLRSPPEASQRSSGW